MLPAFKEVCRNPDCITQIEKTCDKLLPCGHFCCGFRGEIKCLPCLDVACVKKKPDLTRSKTGDDYCTICQIEGLSSAPCIMTKCCGHIFHLHCLMKKFNYKWVTPRIEFGFLNCAGCKQRTEVPHHPQIHKIITDSLAMEADIKKKALVRGKFEGLDKDPRL